MSIHAERIGRVRAEMSARGVDALVLSVGPDLPYVIGYRAMPLERLTMLVVRPEGTPALVIPRLEVPRVVPDPEAFVIRPWDETEDPVTIVDALLDGARNVAVGDQMWARFLVDLIAARPGRVFVRSNTVMSPLRSRKDAAEVAALRAAAGAADRVAGQLQRGEIPLIGRTEAEVSADISARLVAEGHDKVNFAIVAAGENAASPHHHPGDRVIARGEIVLCDFGGTMGGYCSDITRCVFTGPVPDDVARAYAVLRRAQAAGVEAGHAGRSCESVDAVTRAVIEDAGYGEWFVHRTGHGIGQEEHEDPYMVAGNTEPIEPGHAFSVEPGIYVPGQWGMRLEDIVVATESGPVALNCADHALVVVEA